MPDSEKKKVLRMLMMGRREWPRERRRVSVWKTSGVASVDFGRTGPSLAILIKSFLLLVGGPSESEPDTESESESPSRSMSMFN